MSAVNNRNRYERWLRILSGALRHLAVRAVLVEADWPWVRSGTWAVLTVCHTFNMVQQIITPRDAVARCECLLSCEMVDVLCT